MRQARLLFILMALAAQSAAADSQPRLVLHPLVSAKSVPLSSDVGAVLELEAARQPVELIGATEAEETLGARRCGGPDLDACLAGLAHAVRANFALYVELTEAGAYWGLKARVVGDDGAVRREVTARTLAIKKEPVRGARAAMLALFEQLELAKINQPVAVAVKPQPAPPPAPVVVEPKRAAVAEDVKPLPPEVVMKPEPEPEPAPSSGGGVRVAGVVIGVAGVLALGTGGVLGLVAGEEAKSITPVDGAIPRSQLQARINSDGEATAGAVLAIAGGVAAAVGLVMIIVGGPADGAEVSLAPVPGGALAGVRVPLP